ncbi:hypothetical protein AB751O23_AR_00010 [Chlamydiales bacterium SCGC AB-751-O23]|nr:hypothetical protein AB751O23_AR_00010 [Chlamydiales bacterium SCGC AB-751-O23]
MCSKFYVSFNKYAIVLHKHIIYRNSELLSLNTPAILTVQRRRLEYIVCAGCI